MAEIRRLFPGKVISNRRDIDWPPHSLDLSPCDFFLWGFLKSRVYLDKPRTVGELKNAIEREIRAIPRDMLRRVMINFSQRLEECVEKDGRHLTDVIFHK